jgi:hypothetical protein
MERWLVTDTKSPVGPVCGGNPMISLTCEEPEDLWALSPTGDMKASDRHDWDMNTWLGCDSYDDSKEILDGKRVWAEGAGHWQKAQAELGSMPIAKAASSRRRRRWANQGQRLDANRIYSGRIDAAWENIRRESGGAPRAVRIVVDGVANCSEKAADIVWTGAVACVLAGRLEEAGRRVEIVVTYALGSMTKIGGKAYDGVASFVAKKAGAPFEIERALAWLACPASFRHAGFTAIRNAPGKVSGSLGTCANAYDEEGKTGENERWVRALRPDVGDTASVFVPKLRSASAARTWLAAEWEKHAA